MKFIGLDQRTYSIILKSSRRAAPSQLEIKAREIINEVFPLYDVIEELFLPGCKSLYLDFFIPLKKLAIEVQGPQHEEINYFHFRNKLAFEKSKERDNRKSEWCALNNINLIYLYHNESIDQWRVHHQLLPNKVYLETAVPKVSNYKNLPIFK